MLFPGLIGRSKSRKKQLSAIFQLKEEKRKEGKNQQTQTPRFFSTCSNNCGAAEVSASRCPIQGHPKPIFGNENNPKFCDRADFAQFNPL